MNEVASFMASAILDLATAHGLSTAELLHELPFDRTRLDRLDRIDWDDYCTLIERFERACGSLEAMHAIVLAAYDRVIPPHWTERVRRLSPRMFYLLAAYVPQLTNVEHRFDELSDGRSLLSFVLHPGSRPCATYFRGSIATVRGFVGHLGLPPIDAEVLELTDRSLRIAIDLPPTSGTSEGPLAAVEALRYTCWILLGVRPDLLGLEAPERSASELPGTLVAAAQWVADRVCASGWARATVRLAATVASPFTTAVAGAAEATRPIHVFALQVQGREIGLLEAIGSCDVAALGAMVPQYAAWLFAESLATALVRWDLNKPEGLSSREHDTLRGLIRGRSEKEIASDLKLSAHTIHHYVKSIYRHYGVKSRAELMARFIEG